jgi:hypothetical protein
LEVQPSVMHDTIYGKILIDMGYKIHGVWTAVCWMDVKPTALKKKSAHRRVRRLPVSQSLWATRPL